MNGEVFQRLRNDHEQFLEAYEKPTQIYRFLKERQTLKPLFLRRNLSYMPRHARSKRNRYKKKMRVDDLLSHTREVKRDLMSEIKSDNHLKISFCGIEEGFSFKRLLADNADEEEGAATMEQTQDSSGRGMEPGQIMEVEIMLLKFKQSSVRLTEGSCPYSCRSLGKQVLKYKSAEGGGDGVSEAPPPSSQKGDLTLTIPESLLTWRGDQTPGTQMLVFRATCVQRPTNKLKKKLYNLVNQKACRKNVMVEVNRLSLGEIGQKAKQQGSQSGDEIFKEVGRDNFEANCASGTVIETCEREPERGIARACEIQGSLNGQKNVGTTEGAGRTSILAASCSSENRSTGDVEGRKGKNSLTKHGLLQKKSKSKLKKVQMDAAVMTEISFGTGNIPDMYNVSASTSNHLNGDQSISLSNHTFSPPIAKKGFVHRSTSPKLLFRNGSFNGALNGYALPEVAAALKSRRVSEPKTKTDDTLKLNSACQLSRNQAGRKLTDRKKVSAKFKRKMRIPVGSGKRGMRSFLVSFPRVHYDQHVSNSADAASSQAEEGKGRLSTHKRRSEMELLLDGDKPPGQRLSETGIPVFTAEDISHRSSSITSNGSHSPWLESSTRKITPVDHFMYPVATTGFSPTKRTHGSVTPGEANGLPTSPAAVTGTNPRKRISDIAETSSSPPLLHPPPVKQPKVSESAAKRLKKASVVIPTASSQVAVEEEKPSGECSVLQHAPTTTTTTQECKTTTTPPTSVFSAELVVFDSRGECLVRDGLYSLLLQCCSENRQPGLSTFEPLTWSSVFGSGKMRNGPVMEESPNLLLKFSVKWLHGPPKHKLCSELDTALDIKKLREAYFPSSKAETSTPMSLSSPPSPSLLAPPIPKASTILTVPNSKTLRDLSLPGEIVLQEHDYVRDISDSEQAIVPQDQNFSKVFFNFLYSNNSLQQTECRAGWTCPWCNLSCGKIYSLLKHMSMCHPRFHFTYTPCCDGKCVINVHVNKMYNAGSSSFERDPGERSNVGLVQRRKGPSKCLSCSAVLVERHTTVKEDLSEFLNDGSWKRGYNTNRTYYHSRLCLPMLPKELEAEEEEMRQTLEWQNICSRKMIDEFTDVNAGEKELMKLWNKYTLETKIIADKQIPHACLDFARANGQLLKERGMVPNLLSHLVNLYDFGLITPATLTECMRTVLMSAPDAS